MLQYDCLGSGVIVKIHEQTLINSYIME